MRLLRRAGEIITRRRCLRAPRRRIGTAVALASAIAAAALVTPAAARADSDVRWATVNICDTRDNPNTIGIRASMPRGKHSEEKLFIRFRAQYISRVDDKWHDIARGGDSGFVPVSKPRHEARQKGWSFEISPRSETVKLRGMVTMEWRRGDEVVRRARERTHGGHKSVAAADPPGYSAASCTIRR